MPDPLASEPIILAVDPSSTNIGWMIAHGGFITGGTYSPKGRQDFRFASIAEWAAETIAIYDPDILAYEYPVMASNPHSTLMVARAAYIIEGVARHLGITDVRPCNPQTVKNTGFSKETIMEAAALIGFEGCDEVSEHLADAIGVWQVVANGLRFGV